ncbi:ornithine cyclodeaminase family protein [Aliishimia ponticola]|uniref:Ornithine cyclodeaminase family protein n=1 Tax=Aliishimia ponticola TaxID=2499833 RepID=A0A4S4NDL6_9RHOB|nr:ornithine cyclodeaminase family protein [Aliishimia ponticola]THH36141.1 ornithine cyclodeaminase family protein [Aliishimia ponticola]
MSHPSFFSAADIRAALPLPDLIAPLKSAMISVSEGRATHPPRFAAPVNSAGRMGVMYGGLTQPAIHGAKILSLFPGAPAQGLSSHQGFVVLFDSTNGRPLASFDADMITAMRTAVMSMLATQALARPDPKVVTICGAGEQAEWHLRASLACFPDAMVRIWARRAEAAESLRATFGQYQSQIAVFRDIAPALDGADVIHTTTASKAAFLPGDLLQPGQHINLVGASLADSREVDDTAVARVSMFTDARESSARESGEIIDAKKAGVIGDDYPITEIGEVLNETKAGRSSAEQITAYKSHGLIVQDLAAALEVYRRIGGT